MTRVPAAGGPPRLHGEEAVAGALAAAEAAVAGAPRRALLPIRAVLAVRPGEPRALALLERALQALGEPAWQEKAQRLAAAAEVDHPDLAEAAAALAEGRIGEAERRLRSFIEEHPEDPPALRLLAAVASRAERLADAEALLLRAIEIAPHFVGARAELAKLLYHHNKLDSAIAHLDRLLEDQPEETDYLSVKAAALSRLSRTGEAIAIYEDILRRRAADPEIWTQYGHLLRTEGRREDSIAAYRRALALAPHFGRAWWSLANLKTVRLQPDEIERMTDALQRRELDDNDRISLHFALGKALEDAAEHEPAFRHYQQGNALVRASLGYRPEEIPGHVARSKALFDRAFFQERSGHGHNAADPIFVIGMPRAGSTLVEQILASHSAIEGTAELPYIPRLAKRLGLAEGGKRYPEILARLTPAQCETLGRSYLESARVHRVTDKPHFVDKNPNNWMHLGLIRLILPRARVVDIRRHPLDCGLSNFRQLFARGHEFSYALESIGEYYRCYVDLMRHLDVVLPGAVTRLIYEDLVDETETEVRRLLRSLGLPFEEACLHFHRTERAVRTPSSEQVRSPINRRGIGQWRHFEPWLDPLKRSLGNDLDGYRA